MTPIHTNTDSEPEQWCTRCKQRLHNPKTTFWLELSCATNEFHEIGSGKIPPEESQGEFPFGTRCWRLVLADKESAYDFTD